MPQRRLESLNRDDLRSCNVLTTRRRHHSRVHILGSNPSSPAFHSTHLDHVAPEIIKELRQTAEDDSGWLKAEIAWLLRLFRHAADKGECVVSVIDLLAEEARARRVRLPWRTK